MIALDQFVSRHFHEKFSSFRTGKHLILIQDERRESKHKQVRGMNAKQSMAKFRMKEDEEKRFQFVPS